MLSRLVDRLWRLRLPVVFSLGVVAGCADEAAPTAPTTTPPAVVRVDHGTQALGRA